MLSNKGQRKEYCTLNQSIALKFLHLIVSDGKFHQAIIDKVLLLHSKKNTL